MHLHADDFWHYICQGRIAPYLPQAHQQNQTVIDALAQAASAYAAGGFRVICDGIVGPWFIDVFRVAATARGILLHYVILRPDQATALRRAVSRTDLALTDPEPIRSLHRQFTDIGGYEKHVLDSTRLSPQATVDTVLHGLAGGTYHLILEPESDSRGSVNVPRLSIRFASYPDRLQSGNSVSLSS